MPFFHSRLRKTGTLVRLAPLYLLLAFLLLSAGRSGAQLPPGGVDRDDRWSKLKRSQVDEILKSDREKSLSDAVSLVKLAEELREDLEKNDQNVLSVTAFKKTEEIEKLAKRIRGRMKRF